MPACSKLMRLILLDAREEAPRSMLISLSSRIFIGVSVRRRHALKRRAVAAAQIAMQGRAMPCVATAPRLIFFLEERNELYVRYIGRVAGP